MHVGAAESSKDGAAVVDDTQDSEGSESRRDESWEELPAENADRCKSEQTQTLLGERTFSVEGVHQADHSERCGPHHGSWSNEEVVHQTSKTEAEHLGC